MKLILCEIQRASGAFFPEIGSVILGIRAIRIQAAKPKLLCYML